MHYRDEELQWDHDRWPHFQPAEFACRCCGELWEGDDIEVPEKWQKHLDGLEAIRKMIGKPIYINSAHRCKKHNRRIGGVASSQHLDIATDISCKAVFQPDFIEAAEIAGFTGIGRYPDRNFIHLDLGRKRRWRG